MKKMKKTISLNTVLSLLLLVVFLALLVTGVSLVRKKLLQNTQSMGMSLAQSYGSEEEMHIETFRQFLELGSLYVEEMWQRGDSVQDIQQWLHDYFSKLTTIVGEDTIDPYAVLAGKIVAVQTDTPVQKALMKGGEKEALGKTFKRLIISPNYNNAVMELEAGSVDAVALDSGVAQMKTASSDHFVQLSEPVMTEQYGIGFRKGNSALRDAVQKTLKEMVADGSAARISARYFNGRNVLILKP